MHTIPVEAPGAARLLNHVGVRVEDAQAQNGLMRRTMGTHTIRLRRSENQKKKANQESAAPTEPKLIQLPLFSGLRFNCSDLLAVPACISRYLDGGLLEEPLCVAAEYLGNLLLHLLSRCANAVDNSAEIGLINAHQFRQAILPHTSGVYTQLQIRVDGSFLCWKVVCIVMRRVGNWCFCLDHHFCSRCVEQGRLRT